MRPEPRPEAGTRSGPAVRALGTGALLCMAAAACGERTAVERGAELFGDPALSPAPTNHLSCADCHSSATTTSGRVLPGGSLAGVVGRPTYWGGALPDLRESVNACLRFFMRHPETEALSADDPDGLDLLAFLESLGTAPAEAVAFTVPPDIDDDLPAGDAARGRLTYESACSSCHGARDTGRGRRVPQAAVLPGDTVAEHAQAARLFTIEKVRHGQFFGVGGDMPPFSLEVLDDRALADVLAFLGY